MDLVLIQSRFVQGIGAQRNNDRIQFLKLRVMFRELAEFDGAVRSPVSFIETEQHVVPSKL